jgi:hypothetical protein
MNQDRRRSNSAWSCEQNRDVYYDMVVKGHGTLKIRIVTIDEETGRTEFRVAIEGVYESA